MKVRRGPVSAASACRGFTLVELAVTLAILSIAMAIAITSINTGGASTLNQARELKSSLGYARSESVNRNRNVSICASANAMAEAGVQCTGAWHEGWVVFVDENGDGQPAEAEILRRHAALVQEVSVTAAATDIEFSARGFSSAAVDFEFCSPKAPAAGRTISLATSGRAIANKGRTECT